MTMTDSAVRTYTIGETVADGEYARAANIDDWCGASCGSGYVCSIATGHTGPQHVAVGSGEVQRVVDRDTSGDEPTRYAVGDTAPLSIRASGEYCGERTGGLYYTCSLPTGHDGPQHLTIDGASGVVIGAVDVVVPIVEQPTPEVLAERLATAVEVNDNLDRQVRELRDELMELHATHDEFRDTVRSTAIRLARQHDWCSVVDAALTEMGLTPMRQDVNVEVKVTATRTITVRVSSIDPDSVNESTLRDLMGWSGVDGAFRDQISDHNDWETTDYAIEEWNTVDD